MPDLDFSTYPKALPVDPLSTVQKIGALQQQKQQIDSGALTIDKQKLDLVNQQFGQIAKQFTYLIKKPDLTIGDVENEFNKAVQLKIIPPEMAQTSLSQIPKNADTNTIRQHLSSELTRAMGVVEAMNVHFGAPATLNTGNAIQPTRVSPLHGITSDGPPIATQLPPDTPQVNPDTGQQGLRGVQPAVAAPGMVTAPPALPVAGRPTAPVAPPVAARPPLPVARPEEAPASIAQRSELPGNGPATAVAPGFAEGLKAYTEDQALSAQKMTAVKPALKALKLLPGLNTGPGTEQWNKAVAFLKANNIITTEQEKDPTVIYQEANKYLSQYLKGRSSGRSDAELITTAEGSPNVKSQLLPALINLTRSAVSQDRVESSRAAAFDKGQFASQYSKYNSHRGAFPQSVDERAFELDMMDAKERNKLVQEMGQKAKNGNAAAMRFMKSLDLADKLGHFTPDE